MIKMTVAQAMEAIRKETTTDGMKAVLMNCTKADIVKVHEELIGAKYEYSVSRKKKAELCIHVAVRVQNARENEAFRALTVNEKLCKLKESNFADMENQFSLCTTEELRTMVGMLGVSADISEDSPFWEGHGFWCMLMGNALSALRFEPQVMGIVEAGASVEEVCIRLYHKPMMVIQAMIERAGLEKRTTCMKRSIQRQY